MRLKIIFLTSHSEYMQEAFTSVSVYTGSSNEPAYVFYVPTTGSGRHWTVFTYNSITRKIKPVNVVDSFITR